MSDTGVHANTELEQAVAALRRAAASPVEDREAWRRAVTAAMAAVEAALARHTDRTQGRDGTFDRALERSLGRVRSEVQRLTRDHVRIWGHVELLQGRLDGGEIDLGDDVDRLAGEVSTHRGHVEDLSRRSHHRLE